MGSIDCLLDTNILIQIWRGDRRVEAAIARYKCGLETIPCLEFLQGVNHKQKEKADEFIDRFGFVPFTASISHRAVRLIRNFSHSKGLRMADALIASTSLEFDIPLVTLNKKHFDFIDGIQIV